MATEDELEEWHSLGMFVGSPVLETAGDLLGDSLVESSGVCCVLVGGTRVGGGAGSRKNLDGASSRANGTHQAWRILHFRNEKLQA
jgi:hypothetical protein